jgi:hypothetical protein
MGSSLHCTPSVSALSALTLRRHQPCSFWLRAINALASDTVRCLTNSKGESAALRSTARCQNIKGGNGVHRLYRSRELNQIDSRTIQGQNACGSDCGLAFANDLGGTSSSFALRRYAANAFVQSTIRNPATRRNSLVLLVTSVTSSASAWAAISVSSGPMVLPLASNVARMRP